MVKLMSKWDFLLFEALFEKVIYGLGGDKWCGRLSGIHLLDQESGNNQRCTLHGLVWILPPTMKLWWGNVFTPVSQSFCSQGGVFHNPWADTPRQTPLGRHPPGQTPPGQTPPAKCMLGYTLPCPDTPRQTPPLGRHPWVDTNLGRHPLGRHPPVKCMLGYTPPAQCMLGYTPLHSAC